MRHEQRHAAMLAAGAIVVALAAVLWALDFGREAQHEALPGDDASRETPSNEAPSNEAPSIERESAAAQERERIRGTSVEAQRALDAQREPDETVGRQPRPGTERAYYEAWMAAMRRDPPAFAASAAVQLAESEDLPEQVALLRAYDDAKLEPRFALFAQVLEDVKSEPKLREFAVRRLVDASRRESAARATLADYLRRSPADAHRRGRALYGVLRSGTDAEIYRCLPLLNAERNLGVIDEAARALRENPSPAAATVLDDLQAGHPDAAVRERLRVNGTPGRKR